MIYITCIVSPYPPAPNPSPEEKISETVLRRQRMPLVFPSAPFFPTYRILNAKALCPYQVSVTSTSVVLLLLFKLTLRFAKAQSSTLSITLTSRRSPFGDFTSGMCLRRFSWSPPSCKSLFYNAQVFFLNTMPDMNCSNREHYPTTGQAIILSHMSDLPVLLRTVLGHCASPAFARTVTTEHPLDRKCHGRTRARLKIRGRRIT
ncbi:hypothetical protein K443DRAFT_581998 [Laccaria amethystina LaAM-08-1]|uniref:Uncharacterized protein n=1 Tax=Laccaria amethystina LaAM-08-1 TaxID=1095629 RepID=A0A0C9X0C8_9AGAR|nr:hypothetical protein K443DRAFT_581998 [Laccaria amethystina LaAM-08-1]